MSLQQRLSLHHTMISQVIEEFLAKKKRSFSDHSLSDDVFPRLFKFNTGGKMIRGGLLLESYLAFSGKKTIPAEIIKVAAAIELFSSGLLIHDDITDRDEQRRGDASMHKQYENLGDVSKYSNSTHYGTSMATFVGDVDFFLSYALLAEANLAPGKKKQIASFFSDELIGVSLAQLHDITLSHQKTATKESILDMYRLKTARYSLVLPLYAGALLADQPTDVLQTIEKIGENIGIIFQIKDDALGIFGNPKKTGKPCGNDIREGKKTLFWWYGMELANEDDKKKLTNIFGNTAATEKDIEFVKETLTSYGVIKKIEQLETSLVDIANKLKDDIPNQAKSLITELITYNLSRSK